MDVPAPPPRGRPEPPRATRPGPSAPSSARTRALVRTRRPRAAAGRRGGRAAATRRHRKAPSAHDRATPDWPAPRRGRLRPSIVRQYARARRTNLIHRRLRCPSSTASSTETNPRTTATRSHPSPSRATASSRQSKRPLRAPWSLPRASGRHPSPTHSYPPPRTRRRRHSPTAWRWSSSPRASAGRTSACVRATAGTCSPT